MNNLRIGIIVLTVITALVHLVLGIQSLPGTFGIVFLLNSVGYLALLAGLYFIPQLADMRPLIRWALMGFAAITFIAYFVVNPNPFSGFLGLFDKAVELILIILLWMERPQTV